MLWPGGLVFSRQRVAYRPEPPTACPHRRGGWRWLGDLLRHALSRWRRWLRQWGGRLDRLWRRERGHRYLPFADPFDLTDPHLLSSCSFTWTRTSGYFRISARAVSVSGAISSRMTTHSA